MTNEDKLPTSNQAAQISLTDCLACSGCVTSAEAVLVSLQSHLEVLSTLTSYAPLHVQQLHVSRGYGSANGKENANDVGRKLFVASVSPQTRASLAAAYGVSEKEAGNMVEHMLSGPHGIRKSGKYGDGFIWTLDTNVARELCLVLGAEEVMESLNSNEVKSNTRMATGDRTVNARTTTPDRPILTSACPGWICYAEKTHPYILPYLSRLKSPQALLGTLVKTVLSRRFGISPDQIWHLAIMPCFDKKLEASREELTDIYWASEEEDGRSVGKGVRDVDCVITTKELLMLADSMEINFSNLPRTPFDKVDHVTFPDPMLEAFLFRSRQPQEHCYQLRQTTKGDAAAGTSGGYLHHILSTFSSLHPGSEIRINRGRNGDIVEQSVVRGNDVLLRTARYYGFRNIQNLVRKLKPAETSRMPGARSLAVNRQSTTGKHSRGDVFRYAYVEVMACPGGCTNGGGQIKVMDVPALREAGNRYNPTSVANTTNVNNDRDLMDAVGDEGGGNGDPSNGHPPSGKNILVEQREWLNQVDEAYFSAEDSPVEEETPAILYPSVLSYSSNSTSAPTTTTTTTTINSINPETEMEINGKTVETMIINGLDTVYLQTILSYWSQITGIDKEKLVYTTYRAVEGDILGNSGGGSSKNEREDGWNGSGIGNGKGKMDGKEAAAERAERTVQSLAGRIGGGW